jgi:hypothetical protein
VQDECKRRYKDIFSCECVKFSRNRCENACGKEIKTSEVKLLKR